jgi:zinc protease
MGRLTLCWLGLLSLVALGPGRARANEAVQSWFLDDGTEVLLVEDHRSPMVTVRILFPAGSRGDWGWHNHGSTAMSIQSRDPDGELRARADDLAADVISSMGGRWAEMHVRCRKEDLPATLALVRDTMANREFDRAELRRWRKSRKVHWSSRDKDARYCQQRAVARLLYPPDDPRRRGYEDMNLAPTDAARLAEVRDVLVRLPGRRIGFAGDLTRAEVEALVVGLLPEPLEEIPAGLEPRFGPMAAIGPDDDAEVAVPRLTQVYFGYVRDALLYEDPDYPAQWIANHVLGGHFYSRLSVALRHEGGETYGTWSGGVGFASGTSYGLGTFTNVANVDVADAKLREVLRTLWERGITDEERLAALAYLRGSFPFSRQSPDQILGSALFLRHLDLPLDINEQHLAQAEALTLDEINAFIRDFFDPAHFAMIHVVPE